MVNFEMDGRLLFCGCGGGGRSVARRSQRQSTQAVPRHATKISDADAKQVMLRYTGTRAGNVPFYGTVCNKQYRFGKGRPMGLVCEGDADSLLALEGIDSFEKVIP